MSDFRNLVAARRDVLRLVAGASAAPLVMAPGLVEAAEPEALHLGRDQPFDAGWRFRLGGGDNPQNPALDDSSWRSVDLPHDWSIEDLPSGTGHIGPFAKDAEGGASQAFTVGGEGWYRKRFRLGRTPTGVQVEIAFDGVLMESEVWLNGTRLGDHVHGYTPFAFDLTPHLNRGGDNLLAVRVRNVGQTSRWYPGSGIYRPVRIDVVGQAARIARWGVGAHTRRADESGAEVDVVTALEAADSALTLRTRLKDETGRIVADQSSPASAEVKQTLRVASPRLWAPRTPTLYILETALLRGDVVVDQVEQPFGIRIVTFDAAHGLRVNGERQLLRGGCVHHDNGILGAAAFPDAEERRVRLLKARGFTAIRSSHNPCSKAFRNACDRLGMLLIEEAFDAWQTPKRAQDYSVHFRERWRGDIEAMVLSARNSPSVIMWSIGNEIPDRTSPEGMQRSWELANAVRRIDPSRPVTAAIHAWPGRLVIPAAGTARPGHEGQQDYAATVFLDVVGYNYRLAEFEPDHARFPDRVYYASETFPKEAYDYAALVERAPYVMGEFVWTAMDYLGEAGIGLTTRGPPIAGRSPPTAFPVVNAFCGDIDLIGEQKPQSLYRDVVWGLKRLQLLVQRPLPEGFEERITPWGWSDELPSWTWPGSEGRPLKVRVYARADRLELRLNGALIDRRSLSPADKLRAEFTVPYAPGVLEVIAYAGDQPIARETLRTASAPAKLRLTPEARTGRSAREALSYVRVEVLDASGGLAPEAARNVRLTLAGPADLAAFGAAGPEATGSFQRLEAKTWQGRALVVLRSRGRAGLVRVTARADGLQPASASIRLT